MASKARSWPSRASATRRASDCVRSRTAEGEGMALVYGDTPRAPWVTDAVAARFGRRVSARRLGNQLEPVVGRGAHGRQALALALELGRRVGVDVRGGAHLVGVPQQPRHVDALQPRNAVEVLRSE